MVSELLPGGHEEVVLASDVVQEVMKGVTKTLEFAPLTSKMVKILLPMFLEDVQLTLECL